MEIINKNLVLFKDKDHDYIDMKKLMGDKKLYWLERYVESVIKQNKIYKGWNKRSKPQHRTIQVKI